MEAVFSSLSTSSMRWSPTGQAPRPLLATQGSSRPRCVASLSSLRLSSSASPIASHPQILFDHVNEEALGELATWEVSKVFRLSNGSGPTLVARRRGSPGAVRPEQASVRGTRLQDSLLRGVSHGGSQEEGEAAHGRGGRGSVEGDPIEEPGSGQRAHGGFHLHAAEMVERRGQHPTLIAARHDSAFLKNFVAERNAILAKTHPDRTAAKELYLRLLYGGSIENWVKAHETTTFPMMDYALEFQRTVRALVAEDCSKNRDVLKRLRDETARPRELLCYVLNTAQERELIDRVVNVVHRLDGDVLAYEHDGLFLEFEGDLGLLRNEIKSALGEFAFTLKPQLSVQSALEAAEAVICKNAGPHTLELWNARDIRWREHHAYVMKAFTSPPTHHGIFAQVVMRTPAVHVSMPYRVHEIFKILSDTGHKCWCDPAKKIWVMTGDSATDVLKWIVQVVCQRDLSDYKTACWRMAESAVEIESQWKFSNQSFVKAVADALTGELDDESTRHLLNFEGMVLNSKTLEWTPVRPTMRITRSTGWSHSWPAWWETPVMEKFEAALEKVRRQQNSFWKSVDGYDLGPDIHSKLDELCNLIPELGVLHAWTQDDWASTIYELMLLAKGTFGLKQAAALWTRGVGRNGKDTLCNLMGSILGSYAVTIDASTFSKIRDPNAPSPVYALCRARRFVSIREVDGSETMRLQVYKKFTDPISELSGRDLYEKIVGTSRSSWRFSPPTSPHRSCPTTPCDRGPPSWSTSWCSRTTR